MKTTKNYGLKKPESSDFYNVDDFNENADAIDEKLKELETPTYIEATSLQKLVSGEKLSVAFGKIAKLVGSAISHFTTKATLNTTGHVKLSDSSAVTDSTGFALPATEKNATIGGTLANQISKVNSDLTAHNHDNRYYTESEIDAKISTINTNLKNATDYLGKTGNVSNGAWIDGSNTSLEALVNNMKGATLVIYYLPNDTDRQYGLDNSNWGVCACTTLGENSFIEWTSLDGGKRYYKFKCTGTWNGSWYPTSAFNTPANNGIISSAKLVSYEDGCKNNQPFLYSKNQTSGLPKGAEFGFRFVHTFTDGNHTSTGKPNAMVVLFDMNGCIYMNTIQTGDWLGWRQFSSVAVEDAN